MTKRKRNPDWTIGDAWSRTLLEARLNAPGGKVNQEPIAKAAGVTASTISRNERGKRQHSLGRITDAYAKAAGRRPVDLWLEVAVRYRLGPDASDEEIANLLTRVAAPLRGDEPRSTL